jgi:hypothetical protein
LDLEHYRKDAKRLLRAFKAGAPEALARAEEALGGRARARFLLTDAQYEIAVELGYRSWPDLTRAVERVDQELDVNISQGGVISLPVVRVGPCEQKIVRRIGEASLGLYQELLELGC